MKYLVFTRTEQITRCGISDTLLSTSFLTAMCRSYEEIRTPSLWMWLSCVRSSRAATAATRSSTTAAAEPVKPTGGASRRSSRPRCLVRVCQRRRQFPKSRRPKRLSCAHDICFILLIFIFNYVRQQSLLRVARQW